MELGRQCWKGNQPARAGMFSAGNNKKMDFFGVDCSFFIVPVFASGHPKPSIIFPESL
jgi:hypothetical protein